MVREVNNICCKAGFKLLQHTNRNALNALASERALREIYLEGFRIAVEDAKPWTVMSSYNLINGIYTSESFDLLTKILRDDWGFKGYKYSNQPDLKAHAALARQVAADGMVLLKNNGATLPLSSKGKTIAAFGNTSYETITGGTGSGDVNKAYSVSLAEGLKNAGFTVNEELQHVYGEHIRIAKEKGPKPRPFSPRAPIAEMPVSLILLSKMMSTMDVALITIGRSSGEGFDRKEEGDFNLTRAEKDLIRNVTDAFHAKGKQSVVALNVGGVMETASWRAVPDAILLAWQGGQEAGNAMADVLSGRVNPSGKLASPFPVQCQNAPSANNFPGVITERVDEKPASDKETDMLSVFQHPKASQIVYEDGIYVGYRYYETFGAPPAYEFRYCLSYTTFEIGNLSLSSNTFTDKIRASVVVRNTGKVPGKEVVQLYLSAPANKLDKPTIELKGFAKTRLLQPRESQTLQFDITSRNLSSFDPASTSWVAEAGKYEVRIGASSRDTRQTATFNLARDLIVKKESVALIPQDTIKEIKPKY
jgi:beta-glucosidase